MKEMIFRSGEEEVGEEKESHLVIFNKDMLLVKLRSTSSDKWLRAALGLFAVGERVEVNLLLSYRAVYIEK